MHLFSETKNVILVNFGLVHNGKSYKIIEEEHDREIDYLQIQDPSDRHYHRQKKSVKCVVIMKLKTSEMKFSEFITYAFSLTIGLIFMSDSLIRFSSIVNRNL